MLLGPALRRMDEGGVGSARRVELIRGEPLFAPLSLATVEHLAAAMTPVAYAEGDWLMREGEAGVDYILIDTGTVEVSRKAGRSGRSARAAASARSPSCATCRGRHRCGRSRP